LKKRPLTTSGAGHGQAKRTPADGKQDEDTAALALPVTRYARSLARNEGLRPLQIESPALDSVAAFLKVRCLKRSGKEEKAADLLAAYRTWASVEGHEDISSKSLGSRLAELGFERSKRGGVVRWQGWCCWRDGQAQRLG
jgi:hypothetical protein